MIQFNYYDSVFLFLYLFTLFTLFIFYETIFLLLIFHYLFYILVLKTFVIFLFLITKNNFTNMFAIQYLAQYYFEEFFRFRLRIFLYFSRFRWTLKAKGSLHQTTEKSSQLSCITLNVYYATILCFL